MKENTFILLKLSILCSLLWACSTYQDNVKIPEEAPVTITAKPAPYTIKPGDELSIKFFYNPELNENVTVRPDGKISLQLVDEIDVYGLKPAELDSKLTEMYSKELKRPVIAVIVESFAGQRIFVGGEVNTEGVITVSPGMTALQAIFQAGGFLETAQPKEAILIRKGEDHKPIPVRLDLNAAMYGQGTGAKFFVQADDVLFVPKSQIAKANKFVNQYIERLLLFRGVSFGFTYELSDEISSVRN